MNTLENLIHDALGPHCVTSDDHRAAIEAVLAAHERWLTEHGLQQTGGAQSQARIERLERIEAAALNLVRMRGRHHTEIAYQRLVAALDGSK